MPKIVRNLIERFGLLIVAAAIAALFRYYGGLNPQAAILLGGAFAIIAMWLYGLHDAATFKPYRLIVGINYATLWEDFQIVPAEGPTFENFTFTAISPALFARSDERAYSSKLDLYQSIPRGAAIPNEAFGVYGDPTFFLKQGRDGYQIGVHVSAEWWRTHKEQLKPIVRDLALDSDNTLTLTTLPYGYMPDHIKRYFEVVSLWYGFDRKQRRWKEKLQLQGWMFDDDQPEWIKHRYLVVRFSEV